MEGKAVERRIAIANRTSSSKGPSAATNLPRLFGPHKRAPLTRRFFSRKGKPASTKHNAGMTGTSVRPEAVSPADLLAPASSIPLTTLTSGRPTVTDLVKLLRVSVGRPQRMMS